MPFNGSGVFQRVRNWVADAAAGIKIRADYHDAEDDGFAAGLTNCITKDGQTIITQNIPFNSKRVTVLADPVNAQDASTKAYTDTKMPLTGGILTGDLQIKGPNATIILNSTDAAGTMNIQGQRNGVLRWLLRVGNGELESGANAGSNFDLHHYSDTGAYLGQSLNFNRATGLGFVQGDPTVSNGIATKNYVDVLHNAQQGLIDGKQGALGFTPVQQGGGIYQGASKVYIGWDGTGLRGQVDGTDLGRFFMELANPAGNVSNGRLAYAGDVSSTTGPQNTMYEPYTGGMKTGWAWGMFNTSPVPFTYRYRYLQLYTTGWFTVGNA
jgi:hypothetical protein